MKVRRIAWARRVLAIAAAVGGANSNAQTALPLGTVAIADAAVVNADAALAHASNGRADVSARSTVTARPGRNAEVALARGGVVLVCQTTGLHLSQSGDASLLLALDRGAMEVRRKAIAGDVVMTPDLRLAIAAAGPLDLRIHVTFNGDTCVENRGRKAPLLDITDAFGETAYQLRPGQHVLFEHGSLREVVDRETTPCGCPPDDPQQQRGVSIADAVLNGGGKTGAAAYPFPAAASEGLAPTAMSPEAPGVTHVQVAAALTYDPSKPAAEPAIAASTASADTGLMPGPPPPPANGPMRGPIGAIGRFFKRIFVR